MKQIISHLSSFILPITVLVVIPLYIEKSLSIRNTSSLLGGLLLIGSGLTIMALTISSFARFGQGTLAPWSPTKKLVVKGLYRHVRNPMISGVLIVLLGEALITISKNILIWALVFFIINTIYFIFYEEPDLERKFGEDYRNYKKNVSRWLPKLKPYRQSDK